MRRALALVVLVSVLAWARVAYAGEYTGGADPLAGLAPFDDSTVARISGRGVAHRRVADPARVILWDEEPPKGNTTVKHARGPQLLPPTNTV